MEINKSENLKELFHKLSKELQTCYEGREADSISKRLIEEVIGMSSGHIFAGYEVSISRKRLDELYRAIDDLKRYRPLQYILGYEYFFGRKYIVNENVLIPRPETEELCAWIIESKNLPENPKILDIGTGSGCIAVTLDLEISGTSVTGIDESPKALEVAQRNADNLSSGAIFQQLDILRSAPQQVFDIIVSNPPYVTKSEKSALSTNILENEPHSALFVDDEEPLLFYKKILDLCKPCLNPEGFVFFEINQRHGQDIVDLLDVRNFQDIVLRKDLSGHDRFVRGRKA